jgi:hypothetical protein
MATKRMCECKRPAKFKRRGHDGVFRQDKDHLLCPRCFKSMMDRQKAFIQEEEERTWQTA